MADLFPEIEPRQNDVVIAVMGMTGSGKSTFISLCTGQDVAVGHKLKSCTQNVNIYRCRWSSTVDIYLVDTPGFDDTTRSDTEVLQTIANWLTKSYEKSVKLNGMIYLHRIIDPRVGGSARKNLFMFKKICGTQALHNVLLVTTMWELAEQATGEIRETELINTEDFWGVLVRSGAKTERHNNSRESAMGLLKRFVGKDQVVMSIQEEMVNEHKDLHETQAGIQLDAEILKTTESLRKDLADTHEMMKQALQARDQESTEMLRQYEAETQRKFDMMIREREELKVSLEKMHERQRQRDEETRKELKQFREELHAKNRLQQQTQDRDSLRKEREEAQNALHLLRQELEEAKAERKPLEDALMQAMEQLKTREDPQTEDSATRSRVRSSPDRRISNNQNSAFPERSNEIYHIKQDLARRWKSGKARSICLDGHQGNVYCLQFDSHKIITGSRDMTIRIWDTHTFACRLVIGSPEVVNENGVILDDEGDPVHFATGSDKKYATPSIPKIASFTTYHKASILCLRYDDRILVTGSSDCTIIIHDILAGYRPIRQLRHHTLPVLNVAFDDAYIVSCSKDHTICVWDRETGQLLRQLHGHSAAVNDVKMHDDMIASCSGDCTVRLWNIKTGRNTHKFTGHTRGIACLQFSKYRRFIVSGGRDETIRLWDINTGECLRETHAHEDLVRSLHVDSKSGRLVSGGYDGDIKVWDMETGRQVLDFPQWHAGWIHSAQSDYRRIVSSGRDNKIRIMDFGADIKGIELLENERSME